MWYVLVAHTQVGREKPSFLPFGSGNWFSPSLLFALQIYGMKNICWRKESREMEVREEHEESMQRKRDERCLKASRDEERRRR